ncbi:MAG: 5-(carboxyamino)imidazole ribonucleotide synthase [Candidatus Sumerlaeota bacterium]|nr:5-(carboxyamino)imidazole ribonucleotide synthase [Candidatus Sumerlaeota bacterium]
MRVGVLGAGQLGWMLGLAGIPLGLRFRFLDPNPDSPAAAVGELVVAEYDDRKALARFVKGLDVVTFEFENVPAAALKAFEGHVISWPTPQALAASQDRLAEKSLFDRLSIPTARFAEVSSFEDLGRAVASLGLPAVLKTRRFGYDGKGQYVLRGIDEIPAAWSALGRQPLIIESFVPFERELSMIAVRARNGEVVTYPLIENHHAGGILRESIAPAPRVSPAIAQAAIEHVTRLLDKLEYIGVLTVEFFESADGKLLANEMAPRVHNSGHWTIEGSACSQFENHLRALCGFPLGSTECTGFSRMLNLIGDIPPADAVLAVPGAHLHDYGKEPREGRKVGHVTVCGATARECASRAAEIRARCGMPKD